MSNELPFNNQGIATIDVYYFHQRVNQHSKHSSYVYPKIYKFEINQQEYEQVKDAPMISLSTQIDENHKPLQVRAKIIKLEPANDQYKHVQNLQAKKPFPNETRAWQNWQKILNEKENQEKKWYPWLSTASYH